MKILTFAVASQEEPTELCGMTERQLIHTQFHSENAPPSTKARVRLDQETASPNLTESIKRVPTPFLRSSTLTQIRATLQMIVVDGSARCVMTHPLIRPPLTFKNI